MYAWEGCEIIHSSFFGKPELRPHGIPRCTCEDNIKINLTEIRWDYVDVAQHRD
jgi:hypothetical protein